MSWLASSYVELFGENAMPEFEERYLGEFDSPGHYVQELFDVPDELIEFTDAERAADKLQKEHKIDWIYGQSSVHVFSV